MFPRIGVPPNPCILMGFSIINHPFRGTASTPIFGNIQIMSRFMVTINTFYPQTFFPGCADRRIPSYDVQKTQLHPLVTTCYLEGLVPSSSGHMGF